MEMNLQAETPSRSKKGLAALAVLLVVLTSWLGSLDQKSGEYLERALSQATIAYAVARGVNAVVSTLQSTTITTQFIAGVEVSPGELLDPVNDLIERYAALMEIAIGSLIIQMVLLEVVSDYFFKFALTVSGLALMASFFLGSMTMRRLLFKSFLLLAFVRFALVMTVALNDIVSYRFIEDRIITDTASLQDLQSAIEIIEGGIEATETEATSPNPVASSLNQRIEELNAEVEQLRVSRAAAVIESEPLKNELDALNDRLASDYSIGQLLNPFADIPSKDALLDDIIQKDDELDVILDRIDDIDERISDIESEILSIQNNLSGTPDSMSEYLAAGISSVSSSFALIRDKLSLELAMEKIQAQVDTIMNAMALFFLQTLLLPVLFFYVFAKALGVVMASDLAGLLSTRSRHPIAA